MDQQSPITTPSSNQNPLPPQEPAEHHGSLGPIVGVVVIIALLMFGGLYFWGAQLNNDNDDQVPYIPEESAAPPINDNSDLSSSDGVAAIDSDIAATDMAELEASLDADLKSIESDLGELDTL